MIGSAATSAYRRRAIARCVASAGNRRSSWRWSGLVAMFMGSVWDTWCAPPGGAVNGVWRLRMRNPVCRRARAIEARAQPRSFPPLRNASEVAPDGPDVSALLALLRPERTAPARPRDHLDALEHHARSDLPQLQRIGPGRHAV